MKNIHTILKATAIFAALLAGLTGETHASQDGRIRFSNISIDNGLSHNTVLSICQDNEGYIWFATLDGLNRYDGHSFTVYLHDDNDPASIADSDVRTLFLDSGGKLWAGTGRSLSVWNRETEIFENYPTSAPVTSIAEIGRDRILVGTENAMDIFDCGTRRFTGGLPANIASLRATAMQRNGHTVYIGCAEDGLFTYSTTENEFRRLPIYSGQSQIQTIFCEGNDIIWIGTEGDGLYRYDIPDGQIRNFRHSDKPGSIGSNYIRSLGTDDEGRLWAGTFNSLNIYDSSTGEFETYTNDPFLEGSLSHNSVRSIMKDRQGGMWLGTYFGGIDYWHPLRERFLNIRRIPGTNSLNDNIINCIVEDSRGTLWIGTNNGGVNSYSPDTGEFSYYAPDPQNRFEGIEANDIKTIYIDKYSDNIYIGAQAGGLSILHKGRSNMERCEFHCIGTPPRDIYSIIENTPESIWIGSLQGLYSFDKKTGVMSAKDRDSKGNAIRRLRIRTMMHDSQGRLWVGGENGLEVFHADGPSLEPVSSIDNRIRSLQSIHVFLESSSKVIWIATQGGLYSYNDKDRSLQRYSTSDGLPGNVIEGIEEDSFGRLWISTNNGMSCFNPYSGTFRNFTTEDGIQSKQFNTGSHCRRSSGEMFFGGIRGITTFIPEKMADNPYAPSPVLSGLQIFNRKVRPGDSSGILSEGMPSTESIVLRHNQNSFTIEFTVTDYIAGGHNTFAYRLEGFDREWITTQSRNATYSNLPHGRYRFAVNAANNDGKWSVEPTVIEILILPVWYKTLFAKLAFLILFVMLIAGIIKFLIYRQTIEARLELEKKEKEHQEEINQMKLRFFINISHELRTPLTLIITPLQEVIGKVSDVWTRKQLKSIYRNAQRMLHIVNQLMDYRRAELGVFRLHVKHQDAHHTIQDIFSYYERLAQGKKLKYTLASEIEDKLLYIDEQYLDLILNNLLSNAFKYTDKGSISVRAYMDRANFILEVTDTGDGIPASLQERIFERFYQIGSHHVGSGIGLSLVQRLVELHHAKLELESEEGKGSTFRVLFPQDLSIYSEEELGEESTDTHTTNSKEMYLLDTDNQEDMAMPGESRDKKWTLLIVEDNDEIRTYMNSGLSAMFNTLLASNGEEAMDIIKANRVDLIVSDVMMPVMDGIKLCQHLKQDINTRHIPIIMLSARTDSRQELEALKTGADDYIMKPFSMAVLIAKIQNILRAHSRILEKYSRSIEVEPEKITFNALDEALLKRAIRIVEENLDNSEFSTDDFARAMNMSRSNLHLKLKAITGESALDFIHKIRFRKACALLKEGRYTVSEVSDKVGFSSPSYFATCFKKHIGCLPTEYAKRQ